MRGEEPLRWSGEGQAREREGLPGRAASPLAGQGRPFQEAATPPTLRLCQGTRSALPAAFPLPGGAQNQLAKGAFRCPPARESLDTPSLGA